MGSARYCVQSALRLLFATHWLVPNQLSVCGLNPFDVITILPSRRRHLRTLSRNQIPQSIFTRAASTDIGAMNNGMLAELWRWRAVGEIGCGIFRNYCKCVGVMQHMNKYEPDELVRW